MRALLFWLLSSTCSKAISVYDCAHKNVTITAVQCLITISADVTYCGYIDSITYSSVPTRWMDVQNIDADTCHTAAEKGAITVDGKLFKVKKNVVHRETWFSHGDSRAGGHCKGL
jgi:hypothetical protein